MRVGSAAVAAVLLVAVLSACGGGSSAGDRIAKCQTRFLSADGEAVGSSASTTAIVNSPGAHQAAKQLCTAAEHDGVLNDQGDASADQLRAVLKSHPTVLLPLCDSAIRIGLGKNAGSVEAQLPPGGLHALTAKLCTDVGAYVTADGGFDATSLFRDRGRAVVVPICVAGSIAAPTSSSLPFSKADATRLFTRICGAAWDRGLLKANGSVDSAGVRALAAKITRRMVASGAITVQR